MATLAFDIGIKHLAWCLLSDGKILGWDVHNLMEDQEVVQLICNKCKLKANFSTASGKYCKRHCPIVPLPKVTETTSLLDLLKQKDSTFRFKSKAKVLEGLSAYYAMPIVKKKTSAAHATEGGGMHKIHDAIRSFIHDNSADFSKATKVVLENQPAYKNPIMKTVQILLYAELRSFFLDNGLAPSIGFAHAGKKNTAVLTGNAGYSDRKKQTKERAELWLKTGSDKDFWKNLYGSHKKRDDLADALCMCLDS